MSQPNFPAITILRPNKRIQEPFLALVPVQSDPYPYSFYVKVSSLAALHSLPSTFTTRPVVAFIANETNGATRLINISDDDVKTKQPSSSSVRKAVSQLPCTERFIVSRIAVRDVLL